MRAQADLIVALSVDELADALSRWHSSITWIDERTARIPVPDSPAQGATGLIALSSEPRTGGTAVALTAEVELEVPYFQWAIGGLAQLHLEQFVDWLARAITAVAENEPVPELKTFALLPKAPFDARAARQLSTACWASAIATFGGSIVGQNTQNIADTFGSSDGQIADMLSISRLGALIALVVTLLADRVGRRRLLIVALSGIGISNVISAVAPNLAVLTAGQILTRGFVSAAVIVAGIVAIEEAPTRARTFAAAMLALAAGAGFFCTVLMLNFMGITDWMWRIAFLTSTASLLLIRKLATNLEESTRYTALDDVNVRRGRVREVFDRRYGVRFLLLALTGYMTNILNGPSAQFTTKYLNDDRGFANWQLFLFRFVTGLPGLFGMILASRLTEVRGRRPVAAVFLAIAAVGQFVFFSTSGLPMWLAASISVVAASCGGLAIGAMGAELFPTEARGVSNGLILIAGVLGSITGFQIAASDRFDSLGDGLALCAVPTLIAAVLIPLLPEPAGKSLDEISPTEEEPARD